MKMLSHLLLMFNYIAAINHAIPTHKLAIRILLQLTKILELQTGILKLQFKFHNILPCLIAQAHFHLVACTKGELCIHQLLFNTQVLDQLLQSNLILTHRIVIPLRI